MDSLYERVLTKLGLNAQPEPTLEGLHSVYGAWCQHVPFDNVRKLIHVRAGDPRPFPGSTAEDFLEAWLRHGTGGTCWANAGATFALLDWLGFDAERGIATMMAAPKLPPNHGTVRVRFGEETYLVDGAILHGEPLRLEEGVETCIKHAAWGVRCTWSEGRVHVHWRALHMVDGFVCRFEQFGIPAGEFPRRYEETREWSPFNYEVTARRNRGDEVKGVAFGQGVNLHADGRVTQVPITDEERRRRLIEDIGLSEEIVSQLPPDTATPPPPGSRTAIRQAAQA